MSKQYEKKRYALDAAEELVTLAHTLKALNRKYYIRMAYTETKHPELVFELYIRVEDIDLMDDQTFVSQQILMEPRNAA